MKTFMDDDFLLKTDTAKHLFHDYAENLPIYDYHCHLSPKEIWEDITYENITQVWLYGDHYKWRIMRAVGIDEKYITGDGSDYEKFVSYARALSLSIGNPLYHWSHLELKHYFGITETLNEDTAPMIWEKANEALKGLSSRKLIEMSHVALIATTDDPVDSLEYHRKIREEGAMKTKVLPAWRPDRLIEITKPDFTQYLSQLEEISGVRIHDFQSLKTAVSNRIEYFHANGCRISDHGIDYPPCAYEDDAVIDQILKKAMEGEPLSGLERDQYRTAVLLYLAQEYTKHDWVMQLHMSAIRNLNSQLYQTKGPDVGNDAILDVHLAQTLSGLMDLMKQRGALPKTILYSLNPNDMYTLLTVGGCFAGGTPGRIQLGSAWWFNDHIDGMRSQLRAVANVGVLGEFIGMLTDSRSFLSYFRHEYFRRILCDLLGDWVENGEYPQDEKALEKIVSGICYYNAVRYFGIEL